MHQFRAFDANTELLVDASNGGFAVAVRRLGSRAAPHIVFLTAEDARALCDFIRDERFSNEGGSQ
jgi:hypothetical protein